MRNYLEISDLLERGCVPITVIGGESILFRPLSRDDFDWCLSEWPSARENSSGAFLVPVSDLARGFSKAQRSRPARLIAHTGRCGSTLLAKLLVLREGLMVFNEPPVLVELAWRLAQTSNSSQHSLWSELTSGLLHYIDLLAEHSGRTSVVKLTSWTAPIILPLLDTASLCVFQWRDPGEVVESLLDSEPQWARSAPLREVLDRLLDESGVPGASSSPTAFFSRIWSWIVIQFMQVHQEHSEILQAISYVDLVKDPEVAFASAEHWLKIAHPRSIPLRFPEELRRYSKSASAVPFDPSGIHRRRSLSTANAEVVARITEAACSSLREKQNAGLQTHRLQPPA
jgi:hypothetical protein